MPWTVEYTDEFGDWWNSLNEMEQDSVAVTVRLLQEKGPNLPFPHSSGIAGSRHGHMRELRIQHQGEPYRVLYAFDPRRTVILLIGGKKQARTGGTMSLYRWRTGFMMPTWSNYGKRGNCNGKKI